MPRAEVAHQPAHQSVSRSTIKILYAEGDEHTLPQNFTEMQKAGHDVSTAVNRQDVHAALRRDAFDLVILGLTLSKDDRHHLPYMVKKLSDATKGSGDARRHSSS